VKPRREDIPSVELFIGKPYQPEQVAAAVEEIVH
jgi:hypothetical protein